MTTEEYKHKIAKLNETFEREKSLINREYAFSNNYLKKGDIVTDHLGSILIEKIQFTTSFTTGMPCCVYTGVELKKDGTPTKAAKIRSIHQTNIEK